jgi:hypothetical protein
MSLFDRIDAHPKLAQISRLTCEENSAAVAFCNGLLPNDDNNRKYRILKLDAYYNTIDFATPPPSVDCLIIIERDGGFEIVIVELKDLSRPKQLKPLAQLERKFASVVAFISEEFREIFISGDVRFTRLQAWVVLAGFSETGEPAEFERRLRGTVVDRLSAFRPLELQGLIAAVEPKLTQALVC